MRCVTCDVSREYDMWDEEQRTDFKVVSSIVCTNTLQRVLVGNFIEPTATADQRHHNESLAASCRQEQHLQPHKFVCRIEIATMCTFFYFAVFETNHFVCASSSSLHSFIELLSPPFPLPVATAASSTPRANHSSSRNSNTPTAM